MRQCTHHAHKHHAYTACIWSLALALSGAPARAAPAAAPARRPPPDAPARPGPAPAPSPPAAAPPLIAAAASPPPPARPPAPPRAPAPSHPGWTPTWPRRPRWPRVRGWVYVEARRAAYRRLVTPRASGAPAAPAAHGRRWHARPRWRRPARAAQKRDRARGATPRELNGAAPRAAEAAPLRRAAQSDRPPHPRHAFAQASRARRAAAAAQGARQRHISLVLQTPRTGGSAPAGDSSGWQPPLPPSFGSPIFLLAALPSDSWGC